MQRLTKLSKQNILAADRAELVYSSVPGRVFVKVWVGENPAFMWGAQDLLTWRTDADAMRFIRRLRPDLRVQSWGREPAL